MIKSEKINCVLTAHVFLWSYISYENCCAVGFFLTKKFLFIYDVENVYGS